MTDLISHYAQAPDSYPFRLKTPNGEIPTLQSVSEQATKLMMDTEEHPFVIHLVFAMQKAENMKELTREEILKEGWFTCAVIPESVPGDWGERQRFIYEMSMEASSKVGHIPIAAFIVAEAWAVLLPEDEIDLDEVQDYIRNHGTIEHYHAARESLLIASIDMIEAADKPEEEAGIDIGIFEIIRRDSGSVDMLNTIESSGIDFNHYITMNAPFLNALAAGMVKGYAKYKISELLECKHSVVDEISGAIAKDIIEQLRAMLNETLSNHDGEDSGSWMD